MPRRATNSDQCCYKEGNRRCRRTGTGDPPVCNAHKIVFAEAARKAAQGKRPGDAIFDLFDSFLSGKKIGKKKIKNAWDDLGDLIGDPNVRSRFTPPAGWTPPPGWMPPRQAPQGPPPPDPLAEAKREFLLAKRVMGFAESEPITEDMVKDRRKHLARKFHPDRPGGSLEKMQKINAAADVLLRAA